MSTLVRSSIQLMKHLLHGTIQSTLLLGCNLIIPTIPGRGNRGAEVKVKVGASSEAGTETQVCKIPELAVHSLLIIAGRSPGNLCSFS